MDVKWIKLSSDIFDNRKIRMIEGMPDGDALVVIWLKLLVLAGNTNDGGYVYFTQDIPYTEQMLSTQFNRPLATIQLALRTFEQFGMIEIIDDMIYVSNWEKYQNADGLDKIREQTRQRVARYRENKRLEQCNVTGNATVTQCNATEKNKKEDIDKTKNNREKSPTLDEIKAYVTEKGLRMDADAFFDHYEANGWKQSNGNKIKSWQAAARQWARRESDFGKKQDSVYTSDASYELDAFNKRAIGLD